MTSYPWAGTGVTLFAPHHDEVDRFCNFTKNVLAKDGINTVVMIIRYNYEFASHPECRGDWPLSYADVQKMVDTCRVCGIRLIPDMNLLGHQTVQDHKAPDGLLRAHPEFSETPVSEEPEYCYSLCPRAPGLFELICDLVDELADAFACDAFHIGMDEVFYIGQCERCKGTDPGKLLADWVTRLHDHLAQKGIETWMWGDRLISSAECAHGPWDASNNGTHTARGKVPSDIVITDWHYYPWGRYPSVDIFAEAGHRIWPSCYNVPENATAFFDYAKEHDKGHIAGIMMTVWSPVRFYMDALEGIDSVPDDIGWHKGAAIHNARCHKALFRPDEPWDPMPEDDE